MRREARAPSDYGAARPGVTAVSWAVPRHRPRIKKILLVRGDRGRILTGNYLLPVDLTVRLFRDGKATLSGAVAETLERLGTSVD